MKCDIEIDIKEAFNMDETPQYFVYFQNETDNYFLAIKATYIKIPNRLEVLKSFLNEFIKEYKLADLNYLDMDFFFINQNDIAFPLCIVDLPMPEYNEFVIRPKNCPQIEQKPDDMDKEKIMPLLKIGDDFIKKQKYSSANLFFSAGGPFGLTRIAQMNYEFKDWENLKKFIDILIPLSKYDPYINEILGYLYEAQNNPDKARETFEIYKGKEPIQDVAYNRLILSSTPTKKRIQSKLIDRDYLTYITPNELSYEIKSLSEISPFSNEPRSFQVYTHEVIKTLLTYSFYQEAVQYLIKYPRFFNTNIQLFTSTPEMSDILISYFTSKPTLNNVLTRKICLCLLKKSQVISALKLSTALFNLDKKNIQTVGFIMYLHYYLDYYDEIAKMAISTLNSFDEYDEKRYEIHFDKLREILKSIPALQNAIDMNPQIGLDDQYPEIESMDDSRYCDRFYFFIFIMFYLFNNHRVKECYEILNSYGKILHLNKMPDDDAKEFLTHLYYIRYSVVMGNLYRNENKMIYMFGDCSAFTYGNLLLRINNDESDTKLKSKKPAKNDKGRSKSYDKHPHGQNSANDTGTIIQTNTFVIPDISIWKLRDLSQTNKYLIRTFLNRLTTIKEALTANNSESDPVYFCIGYRDVKKYIPKLLYTQKFTKISDLKTYYYEIFTNIIRRIRRFLPKATIFVLLPHFDGKYSPICDILYDSITPTLRGRVEIILPSKKYLEYNPGIMENNFNEGNCRDMLAFHIKDFFENPPFKPQC